MESIKFVTSSKNYFNPAINSLLCPGLERWSGRGEPELNSGRGDLFLVPILSVMPTGPSAKSLGLSFLISFFLHLNLCKQGLLASRCNA